MEQTARKRAIQLNVDDATVEGELAMPPEAAGLVVLVNGQWGVRHASRETDLADALQREGFGTLLVELLTTDESADRTMRFQAGTLADRLGGVIDWLDQQPRTAALNRGFVGLGPGAATVLLAVTQARDRAEAVVLVDGCLDLVDEPVDGVEVPSLVIVDGAREHLVQTHHRIQERFNGDQHHFVVLQSGDDSSTLVPDIASLATNWFSTHLTDGD